MKKFVFVYYNPSDPSQASEQDMDKVMADWQSWFKELGSALVDGGNPFNDGGQAVTASGVEAISADKMPATGYTIVNADDMDGAVELAKGCPMHQHSNGQATVRVYEAMPM